MNVAATASYWPMPLRESIMATACVNAAATANSTPAAAGRCPCEAPVIGCRSRTTQVMPPIVTAIASHCQACSVSPRKIQETIAAVGGESACSKSVKRGPIISSDLKAHKSQTKKPIRPDRPKISQVSVSASVGKGRPRTSPP